MAVGIITTPSDFVNGTVVTPDFLDNARDDINAIGYALPASASIYSLVRPFSVFEDFEPIFDTTTTASVNIGNGFLQTLTVSNARFVSNWTSIDNTAGNLAILASTNADTTASVKSNAIGAGTRDFSFKAKVRIEDLTKLKAVAVPGMQITQSDAGGTNHMGFYAGNDSSYWNTVVDSTITATTIAISNSTFYILECSRIGGTVKMYINGTQVLSQANSTTYDSGVAIGVAGSAPGSANFPYTYVDWLAYSFLRT